MIALGQTIAGCAEPWILKALGDWKPFFLINAAPVALIFITPLYTWYSTRLLDVNGCHSSVIIVLHYSFVFESVRWLVSQGKVSRAVKIIKTIAKANGRKVADDTFDSFEVHNFIFQIVYHRFWQNYIYSQRFAVSHREKCELQAKKNVLTLFKSRRLRNRTILTIIAW